MWHTFFKLRLWINFLYVPFFIVGIYNVVTMKSHYSECYSSDNDEPASDYVRGLVILTTVIMFGVGTNAFFPYYNINTYGNNSYRVIDRQFGFYLTLMVFYSVCTTALALRRCTQGTPMEILATHPYEYGCFVFLWCFLFVPCGMGLFGDIKDGMLECCAFICVECYEMYIPVRRSPVLDHTPVVGVCDNDTVIEECSVPDDDIVEHDSALDSMFYDDIITFNERRIIAI